MFRALAILALLSVTSAQDIKGRLETESLIPDVIDTAPESLLTIKYDSNIDVNLGNELTPEQVTRIPVKITWPVEANRKYTLIMVDPDEPSRQQPVLREILHWLVVNIPGSDITKGDTLVSYVGPGPVEGSGLHRYAFFLFKQPSDRLNIKSEDQQRHRFNLKRFTSKYNLGNPIAGNFFQTQFDESLRSRMNMRVADAFKKENIVPEIIDRPPVAAAQIRWSNGHLVLFGAELTPTQVKEQPVDVIWPTESGALYTLAFIDPDAPSRQNPARREFLHWLVVNIPGTNLRRGDTLTEYIGAGAPQGTGLHRYVFLMYKQPGKLTNLNRPRADKSSREGRARFHVRDFAKEHKLGEPIAGNFFQAQYDDYVPTLHAQLKGNSMD